MKTKVLTAALAIAGVLLIGSVSSPQATDTDGDGLNDVDETTIYFTDPTNPDTDGDAASDGFEVAAGTIPTLIGDSPLQLSQLQRWDGTGPEGGFGFFVKKLSDVGAFGSISIHSRRDGIPDIMVSKACEGFNCPASAGSVSIYSGQDYSLIFQIPGTAFSYASDVGDLDNDGVSDIFVGQMVGTLSLGSAAVFSGMDGSPIALLDFPADAAGDNFGVCVSSIGDITGDGVADLIVGAEEESGVVGGVGGYVALYDGSDGTRIIRIDNPEIGNLSAEFGQSVSEAGDVDGDGTPDFMVGAPGANHNGASSGSAYIFSGRSDLGYKLIYRFDGENPGDRMGGCCGSVDSVGDLNGDGITELAVAAMFADPGGRIDAGSFYIYDGASGMAFQRFDGLGPMRFDGQNPGDTLGGEPQCECGWISVVGDVDHDGFPDFMMGAVGADIAGEPDAGRVQIFSGYDTSVLVVLNNPDIAFTPHAFGVSGSNLGDWNSDGTIELAIGATGLGPSEAGSAYVYSLSSDFQAPDTDGDTLPDLWESHHGLDPTDNMGVNGAAGDPDGDGFTNIDEFLGASDPQDAGSTPTGGGGHDFDGDGLTNADEVTIHGTNPTSPDSDGDGASDGFEVQSGTDPSNSASYPIDVYQLYNIPGIENADSFGWTARSIGDVNGDGVRDIALGAPQDPGGGKVYIQSGADGSLIREIPNPDGDQPNSFFGWYLVEAGDVDLDGYSDIAVAKLFDGPAFSGPGSVIVFSGLDGSELYRVNGDLDGDALGWCLASIGDITGDGVPDLLIGAPSHDLTGVGYIKLVSGANGSLITRIDDPDGMNPDGYHGGNAYGNAVSEAGDVNGDGTPDFIVAAFNAKPNGMPNAGSVFLYSGRSDLGFELLHRFDGEEPGDVFGGCCGSVDSVGDLNGDGFDDIVIGAPAANPNGVLDAGSVYVYSGVDYSLMYRLDGENPQQYFGANNCACGPITKIADLDGDNVRELVIGAPMTPVGGILDVGRVYVFSGASGVELLRIENPDPVNVRMFGNSVDTLGDAMLVDEGFGPMIVNDGVDALVISAPAWAVQFPGIFLETPVRQDVGIQSNGKIFVFQMEENLSPGVFTLNVGLSGTGLGTVTSVPVGINCGGNCTEDYTLGTVVVLTATSNTGSGFTGWSGDPDCSDDGTGNIATVTMNSVVSCTATFTLNAYTLTLNTAGTGTGSVSGAGVYNFGETAMVSETADPGSTFDGWSGPNGSECATGFVLMNANKSCTATFTLLSLVLSISSASGSGGTMTSSSYGLVPGVAGQGIAGSGVSSSYKLEAGFAAQVAEE